jgi:hypothetical protein
MNYYINLFSPETVEAFVISSKDISGFRISRKTYIENQKMGPGDRLICYVTRIQRFIGVLEITEKYFVDEKPIFVKEDDPFVLRFKVKVLVWLPLVKAIPITDDQLWSKLSFTKILDKNNPKEKNRWTHMVFCSPRKWPTDDCEFIEKLLLEQSSKMTEFPFNEEEQKKLKTHRIKISENKEVTVTVPDDEEEKIEVITNNEAVSVKRESLNVQAKLSEIGERLGLKVWLPKNDRSGVLEIWKPKDKVLLDDLPFSFDEITIKTIKNIDVLWIKGRTIVRAFEVEDTTSIYSGILRMADLLSLVPNINIKIHLVAPVSRRDEVFKQISRPVFSVMGSDPLSELCSYISYDSVYELSKQSLLEHMTDTIVDEYSEFVQE